MKGWKTAVVTIGLFGCGISAARGNLITWSTGANFQLVANAGESVFFPNVTPPFDTCRSQLTFQYGAWAFVPVDIEVIVNSVSVGQVTADLGWITPGPSSATFDVTGLLLAGENTVVFTGHGVSIGIYVIGQVDLTCDPVPVENEPPVCDADGPYDLECQSTMANVVLDGTGSSDPDGDPLSYTWTTDCPGGLFDNETSATPLLTVDSVPGCGVACNVFLTVEDPSGETGTCGTLVTINDTFDPTIIRPADATIECGESNDPSNTGNPTVSDDCDSAVDLLFSDNSAPGDCGNEEAITRTWTATDACGNAASTSQIITVRDTTAPIIECPGDMTVECDGAGNATERDAWLSSAVATDTCGSVSITDDFVGLWEGCGETGSAMVTWTAMDECGNTATCSAAFTIVDTIAPTVTCPDDIALSAGSEGTVVDFDVSADEQCDPDLIVTTDPASGSFFEQGVTRVMATATDACTNASDCTFDVIVSCFGVNNLDIEWPGDSDSDDGADEDGRVDIRGSFAPGAPIDLTTEDVTYTLDDGNGHTFSFAIPGGSFDTNGYFNNQKYRFKSEEGASPRIDAELDFFKCTFRLKVSRVPNTDHIIGTSLTVTLQAGENLGQEVVETREHRHHLEYRSRPKLDCCEHEDSDGLDGGDGGDGGSDSGSDSDD